MQALLALSRAIDHINQWVGQWSKWLVVLCILICSGNALVRKLFDFSSNGLLEIQWYLFSGMFLLAGGTVLRQGQHIRIDILLGRFSERTQALVDLLGGLLFLLPVAVLMVYFATPIAFQMWQSGEMSSDPGGLIRWPVWALIPIGFTLLALQAISQIIKRLAFLLGRHPFDSISSHGP